MTCMALGCRNIQCYVCSKSCNGYDHFNDPTRGGAAGNCPLFDDQNKRHEDEVRVAEEKARQQAREENADLDEKTWQKVAGPVHAAPVVQVGPPVLGGAVNPQPAPEAMVAPDPRRPPVPNNRNRGAANYREPANPRAPANYQEPLYFPRRPEPPNPNLDRPNVGPAAPPAHIFNGPRPAQPMRPVADVRLPRVNLAANHRGAPPAQAVPLPAQQPLHFPAARGWMGEGNPFYNPPRMPYDPYQNPLPQPGGMIQPPAVPSPGFSPYADRGAFLGMQDGIRNGLHGMAAFGLDAAREAALQHMVFNRLREPVKMEYIEPAIRPNQLPPPAPRARAPPPVIPPYSGRMGLGGRPGLGNPGLRSMQGGALGGGRLPGLAAPGNGLDLKAEDQGPVPGAQNRNPGAAGRAA